MIIVVEGPSAAGKTTYALKWGLDAYIPENAGLTPPTDVSSVELADFWAAANSRRWSRALEVERTRDIAVCDCDPLKLHYDYCLVAIGVADRDRLRDGVAACRRAIEERQLGIADVILCSIPNDSELAARKQADSLRSRRNFDLHRRLADPLRDWYAALESVDPMRVVWDFPAELPETATRERFDTELFDAWMRALGIPR